MSNFFGTLINRHQGQLDIVQPRVLSRYESARSMPIAEGFTGSEMASETVHTQRDTAPGFRDHVTQDDASGFTHTAQTGAAPLAHHVDNHPHRMATDQNDISRPVDRSPHVSPIASQDTDKVRRDGSKPQPVSAHKNQHRADFVMRHEFQPDSALVTRNDLDHLLRNIAAEGDSSERHPAHQTTGIEDPVLVSPIVKTMSAPHTNARASSRHQPDVNHSTPAPESQVAVPAWLSTLEARLQKRWQESTARSHDTATVNVSIGRVEVRATQSDSKKPGKARNKPVGVMSLEDYLTQRNAGRGSKT